MKYLYLLFIPLFLFAQKPDLLLLKTYNENYVVDGWLMSEKLDGVRAYWDGKKLLSRSGKEFHAPSSFIKDFPPFAIDGELWTKRNDFEHISSITSQKDPNSNWSEITYNIFEVPNQKGALLQRLDILKSYLKDHNSTTIRIIEQIPCKNKKHLQSFLKEIEDSHGEGVVIRNPQAPYINKRTNEALKVKRFQDAECSVIGYNAGKGKYMGKIGSLKCKLENGKIINIGSGLSNEQRDNGIKLDSRITYKYQGLTKNGLPRFPVFLRVRNPE